jgi:transcription termination factor Rho
VPFWHSKDSKFLFFWIACIKYFPLKRMPKIDPSAADFVGSETVVEPMTEKAAATAAKAVKTSKISKTSPKATKSATSADTKEGESTPVVSVESLDQTSMPAASTPTESAEVSSAPVSANTEPMRPRKEVPFEPLRPRHRARMGHSGKNGSMGYSNNAMNSNGGNSYDKPEVIDRDQPTVMIRGILDMSRDGHGVLRVTLGDDERDAYISTSQIRRFKLRPGDMVEGPGREPKENERYWGLLKVDKINDLPVEEVLNSERVKFHRLTPVYPDSQIKLEIGDEPLSLRIIDLLAPIGKGQRSLVVSPPKAGKTTLLKDMATGIAQNYPEIHLMAVLVGERPEEVTDIRRHVERITQGKGETAASNFDEQPSDQCRVAELALERAKRLVEMGKDVVILLDSITRLARAYNLSIPTSGRTLSGGFDPAAIHPTKQFFGAARNFEVGGSLTIVGTALVDTGSRMDDVIFEEFKGTGNQEVILDRRLAERRIFPSIDVQRSGTRRDDLLIDQITYQSIITLQRMLDMLDKEDRTTTLIEQMKRSKTNKEFLASLKAA